jgi:hypothetical protein
LISGLRFVEGFTSMISISESLSLSLSEGADPTISVVVSRCTGADAATFTFDVLICSNQSSSSAMSRHDTIFITCLLLLVAFSMRHMRHDCGVDGF